MSQNTQQEGQSINKEWVDKLLASLQLKIGAREIENSALQTDLQVAKEENEQLRRQLGAVAAELSSLRENVQKDNEQPVDQVVIDADSR